MIQLTLPLAPSVNALWRISGSRMYRTKVYKDWLEEAGWMIREQTKDMIEGEYALHIRAQKTNKRRDLDNILKATSDLLVQMKIVEDDSQCVALAAEWAKLTSAPMVVTIYGIGDNDGTGFPQLQ